MKRKNEDNIKENKKVKKSNNSSIPATQDAVTPELKSIRKKKGTEKTEKKVKFEKPLTSKTKPSAAKSKPVAGQNGLKKSAKNDVKKDGKDGIKKGKKEDITKDMKENIKKSIHDSNSVTEKPDWNKLKKQKKELKEKRKAQRLTDTYDVAVKAKKIWEKLRRSDCSAEKRSELATELHNLLKGQYNKVIFSHDVSRTVQCMLKYCNEDTRKVVLEELKPSLVAMFQSKYAKNCVKTLLKRGSRDVRNTIVKACYGHIIKLLSHSVSAPFVELAYSTYATEISKLHFKQEFYGDMYKESKDDKVKTLSDVFEVAKDMKSATLSAVKMNLNRILNKGFHSSVLVQTILYEFLENCSSEDRSELICTLRELIPTLAETKIGTKVAVICVWHGTNKDRKLMMKALKGHVKDISMSEHGYLLLLALFDSVDDTVLMKKILLSEIESNLLEIALNEHGKHVILYLVARRDSHYFPPSVVEYLKQGDNNANSKKASEVRQKELLEAVIEPLLKSVVQETMTWLTNASICMVTLAILMTGNGENLKSAFESVAAFISNTELKIKEEEKEFNVIEHAGLHLMLKKLIQNDKLLLEKGEMTFGDVLVSNLTEETLQKWIEFNRGCFILVLLLENASEATKQSLLTKVKPLVKSLKSKKSSGASILIKKIN